MDCLWSRQDALDIDIYALATYSCSCADDMHEPGLRWTTKGPPIAGAMLDWHSNSLPLLACRDLTGAARRGAVHGPGILAPQRGIYFARA